MFQNRWVKLWPVGLRVRGTTLCLYWKLGVLVFRRSRAMPSQSSSYDLITVKKPKPPQVEKKGVPITNRPRKTRRFLIVKGLCAKTLAPKNPYPQDSPPPQPLKKISNIWWTVVPFWVWVEEGRRSYFYSMLSEPIIVFFLGKIIEVSWGWDAFPLVNFWFIFRIGTLFKSAYFFKYCELLITCNWGLLNNF